MLFVTGTLYVMVNSRRTAYTPSVYFTLQAISGSLAASARVLKSYEMMLDFYGMRLVDENTGAIERAENWPERFTHLNRSADIHVKLSQGIARLIQIKSQLKLFRGIDSGMTN